MIYAQIEAAKGIKYLMAREKRGGKFVPVTEDMAKAIAEGQDTQHELMEVWEKPPSTQAFSDLLDRSLDKPAQSVALAVTLGSKADRVLAARGRVSGKR